MLRCQGTRHAQVREGQTVSGCPRYLGAASGTVDGASRLGLSSGSGASIHLLLGQVLLVLLYSLCLILQLGVFFCCRINYINANYNAHMNPSGSIWAHASHGPQAHGPREWAGSWAAKPSGAQVVAQSGGQAVGQSVGPLTKHIFLEPFQ